MSDLLIRGLPERVHREIRDLAEEQNLSVNQLVLRLIHQAIDYAKMKEDKKACEKMAFQRITEMREKIYKKYGRFDDSTKIIREHRGPIEYRGRQ